MFKISDKASKVERFCVNPTYIDINKPYNILINQDGRFELAEIKNRNAVSATMLVTERKPSMQLIDIKNVIREDVLSKVKKMEEKFKIEILYILT